MSGGTFTDVVGISSTGSMRLAKVPSTPADPSRGMINGVNRLLLDTGLTPAEIARFIHG